jgi:hypothetical protein
MFPMELFSTDFSTAERIAVGVLSLIALIGWCRWRGTPEDQGKVRPPRVPKKRENQAGN